MEHMAAAQGGDWVIDNRPSERRDGETAETGWIRSAQAGDHAAFTELVRLHEQRVLRVAWRLLGGLHAAQDVFLRMHRYVMSVDPNRDLSPWLYRGTVNVCREDNRMFLGKFNVKKSGYARTSI